MVSLARVTTWPRGHRFANEAGTSSYCPSSFLRPAIQRFRFSASAEALFDCRSPAGCRDRRRHRVWLLAARRLALGRLVRLQGPRDIGQEALGLARANRPAASAMASSSGSSHTASAFAKSFSTQACTSSLAPGCPMPMRTRTYSLPRCAVIERSPLCPALPPPSLNSELARRQIEFVVQDDDIAQGNLEKARCLADRAPALVHVGVGLEQQHLFAADLAVGRQTLELLLPGSAAVPLGEPFDGHEADIVTVPGILRTRVAETDNELHGSRAWSWRALDGARQARKRYFFFGSALAAAAGAAPPLPAAGAAPLAPAAGALPSPAACCTLRSRSAISTRRRRPARRHPASWQPHRRSSPP